jgi:hypothetical protein
MNLLEDLTSGDPTRIWASASAILGCWDFVLRDELADSIPEIREKTEGIDLGGALHPNALHLSKAHLRLEFVRDCKGCLCVLYAQDKFSAPCQVAERGNVVMLETVLFEGAGVDDYVCECTHCAARYLVAEWAFHYAFWEWGIV